MADDFPTDEFYRAREHFHRLLDLVPELRREHLEELRREAPELAAVVVELLERADDGGQAESPATYPVKHGLSEGDIVADRYRILRLIGEGGMAEVYLARRIDGIDQEVALKLVRGGSRMMVQRFVRERQILASLTHPRIAHLIDGGLTGDGLPWFAMEYIRGEPIHTWCDRQRLDLRERARLFARVCRTVQFAHRNLVLHRDLKPSNILVDDLGQPHLLDFGIAKLIDATDPEKTQTVAMTPAYAAPEQLRGHAVSTASDIFQLGLVLRQLLTGAAPGADRHGGSDHTRSRPRLDQTFAAYPSDQAERIAQARGSQPARLKRVLRGDLDRIVRRATAEDPRERYETAQALGDDLDRWRRGLPVNAHGGSFGYRAGKLLRRHAIAASVVFLCAVGLVASSVYSWQRAEREQTERQRAEAMLSFMRGVFEQAKPDHSAGSEPLDPARLLAQAASKLEGEEGMDGITRGTLYAQIAHVFTALGQHQRAIPYAEQAFDLLHPERARNPNAYLMSVAARLEAWLHMGHAHEVIGLVDTALPYATGYGNYTHSWRALLLTSRGIAHTSLNRFDEARSDLLQAMQLFEEEAGYTLGYYAGALSSLGRLAEFENDYEQAIDFYGRASTVIMETEGYSTSALNYQWGVARQYLNLGNGAMASDLLEDVLGVAVQKLNPDDFRLMMLRSSLSHAYVMQGDYARAGEMLDGHDESALVSPVYYSFVTMHKLRLALAKWDTGAAMDGSSSLMEFIGSRPEDPVFMLRYEQARWLHGEALLLDDRCDEAIAVLSALLHQDNAGSMVAADAHDALGRCYLAQGSYAEAKHSFERSVSIISEHHSADTPKLIRAKVHLLWAEVIMSGEPGLLEALESHRSRLVDLIGSEARPVIWQLDLMIGGLMGMLSVPDTYPTRRAHAEAALQELVKGRELPGHVGLPSLG